MENKNIFITLGIVVILIIGALVFFPSGEQESTSLSETNESGTPGAVAIVNGEQILRSDFDALQSQVALQQGLNPTAIDGEMQSQLESQVLESLIAQTLLKQATVQSGITASDADIDMQMETVKGQFESDEEYQQALASEDLTESELRSQISEELAIEPYLEQELNLSTVVATESEVSQVYEQAALENTEIAPLADVYAQVEGLVIQQKQQELVAQLVGELRANAEIEVLI
jgi:peptidyl-prolyl cis-trans isomerase SurA